jgi:aminoglycoside phosphotransferase (APT) family kinase protein
MLSGWEDDESGPTWATFVKWKGFPSRREAAARYTEKTGLSTERLDFYMALALFKLGIIMEGAYARYASGKSDHPAHKSMETAVPAMIAQAARIANIA